jgi:hypothetical protein
MLKIFIGRNKDAILEFELAKVDQRKVVLILEPTGTPSQLEIAMKGYRKLSNRGFKVFITSNNSSIIDLANPNELWVSVNSTTLTPMRVDTCYEAIEAWKMGIEILSEILRVRGIWK